MRIYVISLLRETSYKDVILLLWWDKKNKCNFSKISVKFSLIKVNNFKGYGKIVKLLDTFIFFISLDHIMRQRGKK